MLTPIKPDYPPLLAAGFTEMTLEQLGVLAVGTFPDSLRRPALFSALIVFLDLIAQSGLTGELWLDGSFVTEKLEPDDIDAVFVFDPVLLNALAPADQQHVAALLDPRLAWERFRLHLFLVSADARDQKAYWRGLFGFQHDEVSPKGIALIKVNM